MFLKPIYMSDGYVIKLLYMHDNLIAFFLLSYRVHQ